MPLNGIPSFIHCHVLSLSLTQGLVKAPNPLKGQVQSQEQSAINYQEINVQKEKMTVTHLHQEEAIVLGRISIQPLDGKDCEEVSHHQEAGGSWSWKSAKRRQVVGLFSPQGVWEDGSHRYLIPRTGLSLSSSKSEFSPESRRCGLVPWLLRLWELPCSFPVFSKQRSVYPFLLESREVRQHCSSFWTSGTHYTSGSQPS